MKRLAGLTVVECPYCYAQWAAEVRQGETVFRSSIRQCVHPQAADFYRSQKVYQKAGLPTEFLRINYSDWNQYPPHEGLARAFAQAGAKVAALPQSIYLEVPYALPAEMM